MGAEMITLLYSKKYESKSSHCCGQENREHYKAMYTINGKLYHISCITRSQKGIDGFKWDDKEILYQGTKEPKFVNSVYVKKAMCVSDCQLTDKSGLTHEFVAGTEYMCSNHVIIEDIGSCWIVGEGNTLIGLTYEKLCEHFDYSNGRSI